MLARVSPLKLRFVWSRREPENKQLPSPPASHFDPGNSFGIIHSLPFLYFLLLLLAPPLTSPFATTTSPCLPVHPTRRRNDVLIMRLLGRQIALGLIRMRWKIAAVLESPPHPTPTAAATTPSPLRVSGRLTLASCRGTVIRHKGRCSVSLCVTAVPQRKQRPPDGTRHGKAGRMG